MTNLAYLTPDRALSLLANPPSLEVVSDRINQLETYLNDWFNFRFPETDYVDNIVTRTQLLTLRNYPVVQVDAVRYALPSIPGAVRSHSSVNAAWISDRTVRVPFAGTYQCTYRAGYEQAMVSRLEPLLLEILSRWDELGGLGWLVQPAGDVVAVSLPGGISQTKQINATGRKPQTAGDRLLASFGNYRRLVIT